MATPISRSDSGGGHPKQHRLHSTKGAKLKSSATQKSTQHGPGSGPESGETEDESEGDGSSSTMEEVEDEDAGEPDVIALSDAQEWDTMIGGQRLAGLSANDIVQSVAGTQEGGSDDYDYAGIEDISDDEEFIGDSHLRSIMRAAEEDLIDEFERAEGRRNANAMTAEMDTMFLQDNNDASARRGSLVSDGDLSDTFKLDFDINTDPFAGLSTNDNLDFDINTDPFAGLPTHDNVYQELYNEAEDALDYWRSERHNSADSAETKKRVRFLEPHETLSRSSSMSCSEDPNDAFPDLFAAQDDPMLRSRFAIDVDLDATFQNDYSDAGSCYDFDGDEERLALEVDEEDNDSGDDSTSFNCMFLAFAYHIHFTDMDPADDDGDTTEEETEEEQIASMIAMRRAAGRDSKATPSTPTPTKRTTSVTIRSRNTPASTPGTSKGPRMGTFTVDKSRATMSADGNGNRIKVLPPTKPSEKDKAFWDRARTTVSSRSSTPRSSVYWSMRTPGPELPRRPFTAQSTLGSMFNGNLDILRNNDVSGIAGDLFPGVASRPKASFASSSTFDDSDAEMQEVNMQDFLDIDDSGSESDEPSSAPINSPTSADDVFAFPSRNDSLLNHLDQQRGLVGSFRRNQNQARHMSSLPANPAKRASTSEYNALQKGKHGAANVPITPARRKRANQDMSLTGAGVRKATSSPLTGRRPRSRGSSTSGIHQTLSPDIMKK